MSGLRFYAIFSLILGSLIVVFPFALQAKDLSLDSTKTSKILPIQLAQADRGYIPDDNVDAPRRITPDPPSDYTPPRDYTPPKDYTPRKDYSAPRTYNRRPSDNYGEQPRGYDQRRDRNVTDSEYSTNEISRAGHDFFGSVSVGLAKVIEHAFKSKGRPNGYILGEEAGGAFIAGLRYGEGVLHTKQAGRHKVYWQGPSVGYDLGASGSKSMILVYNLHAPRDVYSRFGGVAGSAYFVGGIGMTFLKRDHITMAPIVSGIGLRLGANVGYLKFTRNPTWNPF